MRPTEPPQRIVIDAMVRADWLAVLRIKLDEANDQICRRLLTLGRALRSSGYPARLTPAFVPGHGLCLIYSGSATHSGGAPSRGSRHSKTAPSICSQPHRLCSPTDRPHQRQADVITIRGGPGSTWCRCSLVQASISE